MTPVTDLFNSLLYRKACRTYPSYLLPSLQYSSLPSCWLTGAAASSLSLNLLCFLLALWLSTTFSLLTSYSKPWSYRWRTCPSSLGLQIVKFVTAAAEPVPKTKNLRGEYLCQDSVEDESSAIWVEYLQNYLCWTTNHSLDYQVVTMPVNLSVLWLCMEACMLIDRSPGRLAE